MRALGSGFKSTGDISVTTSGGAATVVVPEGAIIAGTVSATTRDNGTTADVIIGRGAIVGPGGVQKGGDASGTVRLVGVQGSSLTNYSSLLTVQPVTAAGGDTAIVNDGLIVGEFVLSGGGNSVVNNGTLELARNAIELTGAIGDAGDNTFTNTGLIRTTSVIT